MPKQLIPFIGGKSLLQLALDRLDGLLAQEDIFICAGQVHKDLILSTIEGAAADRYFGEPMGRNTLNAVGLVAAERLRSDPDAVIAVFTADHIIEPADRFRQIVEQGYRIVEAHPNSLVTFGIAPTHPATGYGYLQLGRPLDDHDANIVDRFQEKPDDATAHRYIAAGPDKFLWNSGMFVWRADTFMHAVKRFAPSNHQGLMRVAETYHTDQQAQMLEQVYPTLDKISVDYAVMEPASCDPDFQVVAVPMSLSWLDVGSWPAFAQTCKADEQGNTAIGEHLMLDTSNTLVVSNDAEHLITTIGSKDMIVIHTADATLVCHVDHAERIKQLHEMVTQRYGSSKV